MIHVALLGSFVSHSWKYWDFGREIGSLDPLERHLCEMKVANVSSLESG